MAERIPNPRDEVRFLADLPRGCAEGRAPALQAGSPGAVPGDSTNSLGGYGRMAKAAVFQTAYACSIHAARTDGALFRERRGLQNRGARFDSAARLRMPLPTARLGVF